MITCQEVVEYLLAYVNGELSAEEHTAMDEHLGVCPECVAFLKTYEQTLLREQVAFDKHDELAEAMPEELVQAILAARLRGGGKDASSGLA